MLFTVYHCGNYVKKDEIGGAHTLYSERAQWRQNFSKKKPLGETMAYTVSGPDFIQSDVRVTFRMWSFGRSDENVSLRERFDMSLLIQQL